MNYPIASHQPREMTFESYQQDLSTSFPKAIRRLINETHGAYETADRLREPAHLHYKKWGFSCIASAWSEALPKSNTLTLEAWSEKVIVIEEWSMRIRCRALNIAPQSVHIETQNLGQPSLPFTSTGYRSEFIPLPSFAGGKTVADFIRHKLKPAMGKSRQLELL